MGQMVKETRMFTAAMFTTVQKVGTIHMPRGYEMGKLWYIHIMEYNSAFIVSVLQLNIPVKEQIPITI